MMKGFFKLFFAIPLLMIACTPSVEDQLKQSDELFWFEHKSYGISPQGDTMYLHEEVIKNALDHPHYEYDFMKFREDSLLDNIVLSDNSGSEIVKDLKWNLEGEQKLRLSALEKRPFEEVFPSILWNIDLLSPDRLILSSKRENGSYAVREYEARELSVPGRGNIDTIATTATEEAKNRGLIVEQFDEAYFVAKRKELMPRPAGSLNRPFIHAGHTESVAIEYTVNGQTVLVNISKNRTSEVYYSNGLVHRGGNSIPIIRNATNDLMRNIGRLWQDKISATDLNIPEEGHIRFYIRTNYNIFDVYTSIQNPSVNKKAMLINYRQLKTIVDKYNVALATL